MSDPPIIHYGNSLPPSFSLFGVANQRRDDQPRGFFGRIIRDIAGDSPRYVPPPPPVLPKPPAVPAPAPIPAPAVVPAGVEPKKTMAQIQVWEWQPHATVEMQIAEVSPHPPLVADPPAAPKPNNKIVCPVCMEREPCVVLIPCGHNGYCMSCVANLAACPACRCVVRERIRTYSVAIPDE